ncbi:MAG: DedA family protein [Usitatibacteraceae bacterium]
MEWLSTAIDVVLHLDKHLVVWIAAYGPWIYVILFIVIFAETGLVVTPFLPGDSLLFIAGSLAAIGQMDVHLLAFALFAAAFLGNMCNYEIGRYFGARFFVNEKSRLLNPKYLESTHEFFERWGSAAVIVARFVPFLRTYVPFVAGMAKMTRAKYLAYTVIGAAVWVGSLVYLGYFFGNIPWIKQNLGMLVIAIIFVSVLPILIVAIKSKFSGQPRP